METGSGDDKHGSRGSNGPSRKSGVSNNHSNGKGSKYFAQRSAKNLRSSLPRQCPKRRKLRKGEWTCTCTSYTFPHRFGGGACRGLWIVQETWENNYGSAAPCDDCNARVDGCCEVMDGRERLICCEALLEFIDSNEIKYRK